MNMIVLLLVLVVLVSVLLWVFLNTYVHFWLDVLME